ncbi:ABC transporter ATP-binding protein [Oryzobacter terrae]|uniref:ABC transporter ATP-binding protein n=1 Tax=Oryzobacter terrae TaxID=1620385 RepID=UPI00366CB1EB
MAGAVDVRELRRAFGPVTAVDGASWGAAAGEVTALLGPNGAGKTTTIECLEGLGRPDSGEVRVLGADPWRAAADHRARVGVMLQDGGLPTTVRPLRLLEHLADLYAGPRRVDELVGRLGIDGFAGTTVRRMSGGQRQRVSLAAALLARPDVVFLDEPTAGLDPHARLDVWALLREEAARGAAVVVTTHSFEEAERIADRVVIMAAGRVVANGTLAAVRGDRSLEDVYFSLTTGVAR